jgi:Patatin-like phospholipase
VQPVGKATGSGIGICCSGGGIRSAAFNLGALQSLDQAGVLRRADYLSAVSGGSYIASAYAIASRHSDPELLAERPAFAPGTPEESWVRNHCSYLTNGFTDTVRVVAIALVGFLANLVFFTTLLWTLARPLGWFYAWWQTGLRVPAGCTPGMSPDAAEAAGCYDQATLTGLGGWALIAGGLALGAIVLALGVRMFQPGWPLRQSLRRVAALVLAAGAGIALVTLVLPELIVFTRNVLGGQPETGPVSEATGSGSSSDKGAANLGFIAFAGGAATIVALVTQVAWPLRTVAEVGTRTVTGALRWTQRLSRGLRRVANLVLGTLIGPVALAAAALFILNGGAQSASPSRGEVLLWGVMAVLTVVMLLFADVTSWSLHPLYKWRLSRTFAVVRVRDAANGATGGGAKAAQLPYERPLTLSDFAPDRFPGSEPGRPAFPELLVCAAVNVSDQGTTPPGRSSLSFVFSPLRTGYPDPVVVTRMAPWWRRLLYPAQTELDTTAYGPLDIDTAGYEGRVGKRRRRDITLSAAVAMSGAAIAPAMGKMTRPHFRFLLALTNVRLGVWLPNPANMPSGCSPDEGRASIPANPRQVRLLYEVMGRHRVRSKFLYVTDGGHIENLGLLELLRRRCSTIVCLDAAGGSTTRFSTLGQAIALAASELNAAIDIDPSKIGRQVEGLNACDHICGKIRYDDGSEGKLIYGKAVVTAGSPWDVRAYGVKDAQFPVHPTTDQLFSGEMFDAYQALGRCVGAACASAIPGDDAAAGPVEDSGTAPAPVDPSGGNGEPRRPPGVLDVHDVATASSELG